MPYVGEFESIARLALALAAGASLGWERESRHKPAGLRTHMLVSLGSATFLLIALRYQDDSAKPGLDALKVVAGIVGGVGFLGGGSIIRARGSVQGITTAATIWVAAALGSASAMGYYVIVIASVALALFTLLLLGALERRYFSANNGPDAAIRNEDDS